MGAHIPTRDQSVKEFMHPLAEGNAGELAILTRDTDAGLQQDGHEEGGLPGGESERRQGFDTRLGCH
jgi:hypothetical protein